MPGALDLKILSSQDDIERLVAEIEEEERKRSEVRELTVNHPSHRANLSLHPHPGMILFELLFAKSDKNPYLEVLYYN